jgi:ATP-binding cassette subfamily B protein
MKDKNRFFYIKALIRDLHSYIPKFLLSNLVKVLNLSIPYAMAYLIGCVVSGVIAGDRYDNRILVWAILIICFGVCFSYLDTFISHKMSFDIVRELRNRCFSKIERLIPSVKDRSLGDYERIINGDVDVFEWFYAHILVEWIATFITLIIGIFLMILINPVALSVVLGTSAVIVIMPALKTKQAEQKGFELRSTGGELNGVILDGILGVKDIISNSYEDKYLEKLLEKSENFDRAREKFSRVGMNEKRITELVINVSYVLIVLVSVAVSKSADVGSMVMTVLISMSFYGALEQALRDGTNYGFVFGAAKRVYDLLNEKEYVSDSGKLECVPNIKDPSDLKLEISDLGFRYPGSDKKVIDGLSFILKTNEIVAMVAPSGTGKTTIVNLIERFWDYNEGGIYINETELKELKLSALRRYISIVSQDIYLFNMSILDNLRLAKKDASRQEIENACERANAFGFIKELPNGLDTVVGERGTRLSGGQKQRIAIAQALLRDTPIIIFDEATSNLDVKKELGIMETLRKIKKDKIILVVAHRQTTIDAADRIVKLEKAV